MRLPFDLFGKFPSTSLRIYDRASCRRWRDSIAEAFKGVIQHLGDQVAAGASLADAMEKHAAHLDELCLSVVHIGENTGQLGMTMRAIP